jgi:spore coat polysaccharide biosynthesis protein SpsF
VKITGVVQARMGSSRLPGKVMRPLVGRPLIWHVIDRLRQVPGLDGIVLATTADPRNDPLVAYCDEQGISAFRERHEDDIVSRLLGAAALTEADAILKVNADCPMIDPAILTLLVERFFSDPGVDMVCNWVRWTWPVGMNAEIVTRAALERCDRALKTERDRELAMLYMRDHPRDFRLTSVEGARDLTHLHWAVDTPEDYEFVGGVFSALWRPGPAFGVADILSYLDRTDRATKELKPHERA